MSSRDRRNIEDVYPLSPMQQGLLFHHLYAQEEGVYVVQITCELSRLNVSAFEQAWQKIVARHSSLRTAFVWKDPAKPLQIVGRQLVLPLHREDWRGLSHAAQEQQFDERLATDRQRSFSLNKAPLMRLALFQIEDNAYKFLWSHHHLLLDGWSVALLFEEVFAYYEALCRAQHLELGYVRPYRDYIAWLQQQDHSAAETYWRQYLRGFTSPTPLGVDRCWQHNVLTSSAYAHQEQLVGAELTEAVQQMGRHYRLTINTIVQSAWALLLARYSRHRDVLYGVTVSGRPGKLRGVERMVGLFINTLPVRVRVEDREEVEKWLGRVQGEQVELRQYEYSALVEVQGWSEVEAGRPLFESMVVFENYPLDTSLQLQEQHVVIRDIQSRSTMDFPLTLTAMLRSELLLHITYDKRRFDDASIRRMLQHLRRLLEAMTSHPSARLCDLPLLTEAETQQLLYQWNDTDTPISPTACIHQLFEQQAQLTPNAIAVISEEEQLSYRELNERANQLAHYLMEQGVGAEQLVGISMERCVEMVVGMLGVLKAGGGYVPLDVEYPAERLKYMLEDAGVNILLTQQHLVERLGPQKAKVVCLDTGWEEIGKCSAAEVGSDISASNLAYVIYTSGSTGLPKGVMISHDALVNFAIEMSRQLRLRPSDRILQFASISFDVMVEEIFPAWLSGAAVVLRRQPAQEAGLARVIKQEQVSGLELPTVYWQQWMQQMDVEDWQAVKENLRFLIVGGERTSLEYVRDWERTGIELIHVYGVTEAAVTTTLYRLGGQSSGEATARERDSDEVEFPIGKVLANMQVYVLDEQMQPVPVGITGELYIAGAGLARGYLNRPDLSAERFLPHPFSTEPGARLYRTGDLVRWRLPVEAEEAVEGEGAGKRAGELEYIGRIDEQVKIRGYRIEIGEVEAVLGAHPSVNSCVVIAREEERGERRLVGYVVRAEAAERVEIGEIRRYMGERLPEYMIPAVFVELEELPLTANGKVDRRALPAPSGERRLAEQEFTAPRTEVEELLCSIWAEVLKVDKVGIHDNFFALGGHSLLAMQVVARMRREFGIEMPLRSLFELRTVSTLARRLEAMMRDSAEIRLPPIERVSRDEALPLSFAQQRLWFIHQLSPESTIYNIPYAVRLTGDLDVAALEQAFVEIVRRHEVLRTTFSTVDGQPAQVIAESVAPALKKIDLGEMPEREREEELQRLVKEAAQQPFDLAQGPLLRATLVELSERQHVLLCVMDHIVSDGWSTAIFIREMTNLYRSFSRGEPSALPELSVQYADFAYWQQKWLRGEVLDRQLAYWKQQLSGAPAILELPTDKPRPALPTFNGAFQRFTLANELSESVKALGRREGATLFMTLLAAFQVLLSRYSGQQDIVVGSPVAGRSMTETEQLIGFFVNTLVLRASLAGEPNFREVLRRVRETCLGAYAHQDMPFEKLVEELQPERNTSQTPLFQVVFALEHASPETGKDPTAFAPSIAGPDLALNELHIEPMTIEHRSAQFELTLMAFDEADGLTFSFLYKSDLFDASTITRMAGHFERLLREIVADSERPISTLPLLGQSEQHQLLARWGVGPTEVFDDACLHQLFEAQAARTPDAVAVIFEGELLTYRELNRRANGLARKLMKLGIGPEVRVGICLDSSLEMIVGILGILKAGGAYVPIDPAYPQERLAFILKDARISLVLADERLRAMLASMHVEMIRIDTETSGPTLEADDTAPGSNNVPENLAYIIYTSGSTGRPKGVMVSHRAICNHLLWRQRHYPLTAADRFLQKASFSFDISVWEIFGPLLAGARLVMARPGGSRDSAYLVRLMAAEQITVAHFSPVLLQVWLEEKGVASCQWLRQLFCGGEALSPELQERFFACFPAASLHHQYGPTETTVDVAFWNCLKDDGRRRIPIGRPIANTQLYILDAHLQPAPISVPGELYVGGVAVARGYLNHPELTAEKFVPHPFSDEPGARLYRTGDRARYLPDGQIEFLGRLDQQVKIRGYRIEPGEIEQVLREHPAVQDAVVLAAVDRLGYQSLVSYVVPHPRYSPTIGGRRRYRLPNKLAVVHLNKNETDFLYREIFEDNEYARHGIRFEDDATIFDVGANIGLFTLLAHRRCRGGVIYAFEPNPHVCELLKLNVSLYEVNAKVLNCGLSNENRSATFTFYPQFSFLSGLYTDTSEDKDVVRSFIRRQQNNGDGAEKTAQGHEHLLEELLEERFRTETCEVRLRTLSDVIQEYGVERIDLLKINVEKSESDVLEGVRDRDWEKIRQVVLELHDIDGRLEKVTRLLEHHGFHLVIEQDWVLESTMNVYYIYATREAEARHDSTRSAANAPLQEIAEFPESILSTDELLRFLKEKLPHYMIPNSFLMLESLPLNRNGKIDHRALVNLGLDAQATERTFIAPRSPAEKAIAAMWTEVLGREDISIHDNFFDLGGHSLLATQVIARLRDSFNLSLEVRRIFETPTIESLAAHLELNVTENGYEGRAEALPSDIKMAYEMIDSLSDAQVESMLKQLESEKGGMTS
jgi:amino acid adenylation domain-containing protein/FkbM family methyltransferase